MTNTPKKAKPQSCLCGFAFFYAHLFPQVKITERQEHASLTVFACAVALLPWRDETTLLK